MRRSTGSCIIVARYFRLVGFALQPCRDDNNRPRDETSGAIVYCTGGPWLWCREESFGKSLAAKKGALGISKWMACKMESVLFLWHILKRSFMEISGDDWAVRMSIFYSSIARADRFEGMHTWLRAIVISAVIIVINRYFYESIIFSSCFFNTLGMLWSFRHFVQCEGDK